MPELDDDALLRYSRQIMLPQIDVAGQEQIGTGRVAIIGLGGLGSPVAMYLAAAGVGRLTLVDGDRVELSNLQRQIVHGSADVGRRKVESAAARLTDLNPLVELVPRDVRVDAGNLDPLLTDADVVVDCSDNFATRNAVNAATVAARRPLVSGAAIRFEGQVSVFRNDLADAPCYQCLYGPGAATEETCTTNGVIAPLLGIIGSIQALEVLKLLTRRGESLAGRMLLLDGLSMQWQEMRFAKDPACAVCGSAGE